MAAAAAVLLAVVLTVSEATSVLPRPLLLAAAVLLLAAVWRRLPRLLALAALLCCAVQGAARVHAWLDAGARAHSVQDQLDARLARLEGRKQDLVGLVQSSAARAAAVPDVRAAGGGDPAALLRLFRELGEVRGDIDVGGDSARRPSLAVHVGGRVVAWSGRVAETLPSDVSSQRPDVFVVEGTVSSTLVSLAPLGQGAFITAALPLSARRNIRNELLRDFDLLAGADTGVEIRYLGLRPRPEDMEPFPPLDPALEGREAVLRAPDGEALAAVRLTAPRRPQPRPELQERYARLLALAVLLACGAWGALAPLPARRLRCLVAVTAARGALLYLGPPWPPRSSSLLSPEVYASDVLSRLSPALGALLRSPLDLLLTTAWLAVVAALAFSAASRLAPPRTAPLRLLLAGLLSGPVLAAPFLLAADAVANSSLDLEAIALAPRSGAHLVMHVGLLLALAAAALAAMALLALAGPWPRPFRTRLTSLSHGARAGVAIAVTAVLTAVLYPTLVSASLRNTRQQVQSRYAREVLAQSEVRRFVLNDAKHRVDTLRLLEEAPPGLRRPNLEELAFFAWSSTELALRGVSSAVEIQDASGNAVSRFALNLPSLASLPLPANDQWKEDQLQMELVSTERTVLHARRLLTYHGAVHGAVHIMVADDFWNLPFLRGHDPYSELFRTRPARDRPVAFLSWDPEGRLVFSSTDDTVPLPAGAAPRAAPGGYWTALELDGRPHTVYVFTSDRGTHALAVPSLGVGAFTASLAEAVAGMVMLALGALLLVVLARTALRRPSLSVPSLVRAGGERFVRRLLLVFLATAVFPVVVLQVLVHRFVAGRLEEEFLDQARERAEVARKVARDYVRFLRREQGPGRPITDDPLVWIADTVGNDVDVFEQGRLLASSKRELYDAGLLPRRLSGAVYREIILAGRPFYTREERIGQFSYRVASVPLQLEEGGEPWILSLPLVTPQRDVAATVADIERRVRLASIAFVALAAVLAQSMARRISGPISSLTDAARRIAQGDLQARVEPNSRDELRRLVEAFNQMAGDLERQRRDLERSNRLAAWAEMARQVAHEVKNPLTPIQLSAEHLRRVWRDGGGGGPEFDRALDACTSAILKQVQTLRGIVTEFSAFARPPAATLEREDPAALLEDVLRPYLAGRPEKVALRLEVEPGVPAVMADRRLLERAVVNLVENALQAVGDAGAVVVRLRATPSGHVEIEVADSGPGIDPEVRDRIFEPFFSTKTAGSGIGLTLVKRTAEDHGGGVRLESEPGQGTRAILWLPAAA